MLDTPIISNYDCDVLLNLRPMSRKQMTMTMILSIPMGLVNIRKQVYLVMTPMSVTSSLMTLTLMLWIRSQECMTLSLPVRLVNVSLTLSWYGERELPVVHHLRTRRGIIASIRWGYKKAESMILLIICEHSRGQNSWPNSVEGNPYMRENFNVWGQIQSMNGEELKQYYSNREHFKKANI